MGQKHAIQKNSPLENKELKNPILFTGKWEMIQVSGDELTKRYSHSACVIGDSLYYFGGVHTDYKNDMFKFDLCNHYWELLECKGRVPSKRASFASCVRKGYMYVYGGYDGTVYMNDIYEFDPTNNTWREIVPNGSFIPPVIGCQTIAIYDDKLWSFGGYRPVEGITDDFHCFDFSTNEWSRVICSNLSKKRSQHVSVLYENCLLVFGGYYHGKEMEMNEFNFYTKAWSLIPCHGDIPKRTSKLGAAIHGDHVFMFGGQTDIVNNEMYVLNLSQRVWIKVQMEGTVPTPRQWHFLVVWNNCLFVTCGCNGNKATTTELYKIQLPKIREKPGKLLLALHHQSFVDVNIEYL